MITEWNVWSACWMCVFTIKSSPLDKSFATSLPKRLNYTKLEKNWVHSLDKFLIMVSSLYSIGSWTCGLKTFTLFAFMQPCSRSSFSVFSTEWLAISKSGNEESSHYMSCDAHWKGLSHVTQIRCAFVLKLIDWAVSENNGWCLDLRVRFFGKIQIRILVSKNGFCVSLPKSENGLIRD